MGGLARSYGPSYRDEEGKIGAGADCFADLIAHWLDVAAESRMPCDPRLWTEARITSTYPACMAVVAAREQGAEAGSAYLRRAREALVTERKKLDHTEALVAEAGPAGIDPERFRIDLESNAILEAFAADLDEAREIPGSAREAGIVRRTEGRDRLSFPSAIFVSSEGARHPVWGPQRYERYRAAATAAGATPATRRAARAARGDRALRPLRDARDRGADRTPATGRRGRAVGARPRVAAATGSGSHRDALGGGVGLRRTGAPARPAGRRPSRGSRSRTAVPGRTRSRAGSLAPAPRRTPSRRAGAPCRSPPRRRLR